MYRFKTLTATVAVTATAYTSLSRTYASRCAAEEGEISDGANVRKVLPYASRCAAEKGEISGGANVRKVLPPHLQSDNVAKLTCESSASGGICDVFLVGTTHGSPESKREVENIIHFLKPEVVFLELCPTRSRLIEENQLPVGFGGFDPHSIRVKSVGKNKLEVDVKGVVEEEGCTITINGEVKHGNLADCEFVAAYLLAIIYGRKIILGDRSIKLLVSSIFVDYQEEIGKCYHLGFDKVFILQEVFKSNESRLHKLFTSKLMESFNKVIVDERDQYMSVKLLEAARQHSSVVAVVGRAHLEGIQKNWKQPVELEPLLVMPKDPWIVAFCVLSAGSVGAFCIIRKIR